MGFSANQLRALRRDVDRRNLRTRQTQNGRALTYIEGWHAVAEANRIFGFGSWDRETVESRCILAREIRGAFTAIYVARVRITVRAHGETVIREGHGTGESKGTLPGDVHDMAIKTAETDATKRALATFGKPFGLSLYLASRRRPQLEPSHQQPSDETLTGLASSSDHVPSPSEQPVRQRLPAQSDFLIGHRRRARNKDHLIYVGTQPCLLCGRTPSDAHHLRYAQPRAMSRKVSDEFTVPLCRTHHRQLHQSGDEVAWWNDLGVDPLPVAQDLWQHSRGLDANKDDGGINEQADDEKKGDNVTDENRHPNGAASEQTTKAITSNAKSPFETHAPRMPAPVSSANASKPST